MNKEEIFNILQIGETKETELIRSAYMEKLAYTNPEDNQEGFKRLRQAYEEAMALAEKAEDNSPVGLWIKAVEDTYNNFDLRIDKWSWEELLEDEVCTDAGTYADAREAFCAFLMNNVYIPDFLFDMIYSTFKIKEDYEELSEKFPTGFLDFLLRRGNGIKIELVQGDKGEDVDKACNLWFDYRKSAYANDEKQQLELIDEYTVLNVKMPYFDVDIAVYMATNGQNAEAEEILAYLEPFMDKDGYILSNCANAQMKLGNIEKANEICNIAEEKYPENTLVKVLRAEAKELEGDYATAKKMYEKLYEKSDNPDIFARLQGVNEKLINTINSETEENKIELGWCYYQNEKNEELIKLMDSFEPKEEKNFQMYYNLRSRALLASKRYDEALECIDRWRFELDRLKTENEKEENDRKRRIVLSAFFAARCLRLIWSENNDKAVLEKALEKAEEPTVCEETQPLLQLWLERAAVLKELGQYEKAVELCTAIYEKDNNCIPACFIRQECNFELRRPGAVLDDYRLVTDLVPDLDVAFPYAVAAHLFVAYDRYDDALNIIKRAEDNNAESDYLSYVKASALRYKARCEEETRSALEILTDIASKPKDKRTELNFNRTLDLYEEICFAHMDLKQWKEAESAVDKAIDMEPENMERYRIKLDIFRQADLKNDFDKCVRRIKAKFGTTAFILYEQARTVEGTDILRAIKLYSKALKLDDSYKDTNSRLRALYQKKYLDNYNIKDFDLALSYADKEISIYPYAREYVDRGILYMNAGRGEEAEQDFRKAVELDDEYVWAYEWLGDSLRIQKKHENAINAYEQAYKISRNESNYYVLKDYSLGLEAAMDYKKAIEILLEMAEKFPEDKNVLKTLAGVYQKDRQYDKSYEAYMSYRKNPQLEVYELVENDMDLLELMLSMDNKKQEAFELISATYNAHKRKRIPRLEMNMAFYYCYYENNKQLTCKYADKAVKYANAGRDISERRYCIGKRMEMLAVFNDRLHRVKTQFTEMSFMDADKLDPFSNKKVPYFNLATQKVDLFKYGMYYYYKGDKKTAFKMFKDMQTGCNCTYCGYNVCVEAIVGKALMHEDKGEYKEALECLERVLEEGFDPYLINRFIERIKEKM